MTLLEDHLARAVTHLHGRAQAFAAQLSDTVHPRLLGKEDDLQLLRDC